MINKIKCWLGWHQKAERFSKCGETSHYEEYYVEEYCPCCFQITGKRFDKEYYYLGY